VLANILHIITFINVITV